jgi:hypothetical protein
VTQDNKLTPEEKADYIAFIEQAYHQVVTSFYAYYGKGEEPTEHSASFICPVEFELSDWITYEIVKMYSRARKRLLDYHPDSFPEDINIAKTAGYICYSIAKFKPIFIRNLPDKTDRLINEYFGLHVALAFLSNDYKLSNIPMLDRVRNDFINVLRYKTYDEHLCILMCEMIAKDCKRIRKKR